MSGVARGLLVLEHIASLEAPPTHAELVRATGMAKSTLTSVLGELIELGYVEQHGRSYVPGGKVLSLGYRFAGQLGITPGVPEAVRDLLQQLARRTGETAIFSVEVGRTPTLAGNILALDHAESTHLMRYVPGLGKLQPVAHTAAGYVMLAFSGRDHGSIPRDTLYVRTPYSLTDPAAIDTELQRVRERGYAHNIDHTTEGVTSIAVPWMGDKGLVGAVSIVGPTPRMAAAEPQVFEALLVLKLLR